MEIGLDPAEADRLMDGVQDALRIAAASVASEASPRSEPLLGSVKAGQASHMVAAMRAAEAEAAAAREAEAQEAQEAQRQAGLAAWRRRGAREKDFVDIEFTEAGSLGLKLNPTVDGRAKVVAVNQNTQGWQHPQTVGLLL